MRPRIRKARLRELLSFLAELFAPLCQDDAGEQCLNHPTLFGCRADAIEQAENPTAQAVLQPRQRTTPLLDMAQCIERNTHARLDLGQRHLGMALANLTQQHHEWVATTRRVAVHLLAHISSIRQPGSESNALVDSI